MRVVAAEALVLVAEVSSGSALLFEVGVTDSFFEVGVADEIEVTVGIDTEVVLECVLTGRLNIVEFLSEISPAGIVKEDVKEETAGRDPFIWVGSATSVVKD